MKNNLHIRALFQKYLDERCTAEEIGYLFEYFGAEDPEHSLRTLIQEELHKPSAPSPEMEKKVRAYTHRVGEHLRHEIKQQADARKGSIATKWLRGKWLSAAAAVIALVVVGTGWWYRQASGSLKVTELQSKYGEDVSPGGRRATLTLADGSRIDLDSVSSGLLARQAGISVKKSGEGLITYEIHDNDQEAAEPAYNTIATPKGGQYQVQLPDGSKVWLNAASSLRYPTRFTGTERIVTLSGEGYFEVNADSSKPFIVQSREQQVQVTGTQFNINAYDNTSSVSTTLVEGKVQVMQSESGDAKWLKPGEQSRINPEIFEIHPADIEESIAWKSGYFIFNNTDLKTIMQQMERWYDVEAEINRLPEKRFYGKISREVSLSKVLDMMQQTSNLNFEIKGRRIMVQP